MKQCDKDSVSKNFISSCTYTDGIMNLRKYYIEEIKSRMQTNMYYMKYIAYMESMHMKKERMRKKLTLLEDTDDDTIQEKNPFYIPVYIRMHTVHRLQNKDILIHRSDEQVPFWFPEDESLFEGLSIPTLKSKYDTYKDECFMRYASGFPQKLKDDTELEQFLDDIWKHVHFINTCDMYTKAHAPNIGKKYASRDARTHMIQKLHTYCISGTKDACTQYLEHTSTKDVSYEKTETHVIDYDKIHEVYPIF